MASKINQPYNFAKHSETTKHWVRRHKKQVNYNWVQSALIYLFGDVSYRECCVKSDPRNASFSRSWSFRTVLFLSFSSSRTSITWRSCRVKQWKEIEKPGRKSNKSLPILNSSLCSQMAFIANVSNAKVYTDYTSHSSTPLSLLMPSTFLMTKASVICWCIYRTD